MQNEKLEFSTPILTVTELQDFDQKINVSVTALWSIGEIPDINE